jgi:hypothetical protein
MSKKLKILAVIVVLGLICFIAVWKYTFKTSDSSAASEKAAFNLKSTELVGSFETDETNANALYLGKVLIVSGRIDQIKEDSLAASVYLKEADAISGVMCSFSKENIDLAKLAVGDEIKVKGICTGYLMDAVMNRCSLE